jgi:hypothetical protein
MVASSAASLSLRLLLLQVLAETQGNTSAVPFDQIDKVSTDAVVTVVICT